MKTLDIIAIIGNNRNPKSLLLAYKELKSKTPIRLRNKTCGVDNITIDQFDQNLLSSLQLITKSMRSKQGYNFSNLKAVLVPKINGKDRLICIPTVSDRIVQKSILNFLTINNKYAKFNGVSYGFIKGKSTTDAIRKALLQRKKKPYIYKTDISSYFDSIDRRTLESVVVKKVRNKSIHDLLIKVINCEIEFTRGSKWRKIQNTGIVNGVGIRQGMPLSPFFANLFLYDFDNQVIKNNISMIRYADDLLFFADNEEECLKIHKFCKNELAKINLSIHEINAQNSKTLICNPDKVVEFLGVGIEKHNNSYQAVITSEQYKKIKEKFIQYSDINFLSTKNINIVTYLKKLESIKNGYLEAYSICNEKIILNFENLLDKWIAKAKQVLFEKGLNIDISKLSKQQSFFLGFD